MNDPSKDLWHRSNKCDSGACLEVSFHSLDAEGGSWAAVRNSREPDWIVLVQNGRWQDLVATAQTTRRVDLAGWFPPDRYGRFAAGATQAEAQAFQAGIIANEPGFAFPA
jgi:hypothetical protein